MQSVLYLRSLQEQMEQTLSDSQQRLSLKKNELLVAHHKMKTLEEKVGEKAFARLVQSSE